MWNKQAIPQAHNYVEYHIYDLHPQSEPSLESIMQYSQSFTSSLLPDHIWQIEPFNLSLHPNGSAKSSSSGGPVHLFGLTRFGDNIEDEWVIVYMLLEICGKYDKVAVSVSDDDGEFLLIEGSQYIPSWLNPDNGSGRVWIKGGKLRILPFGDRKKGLSVEEGLRYLSDEKLKTECNEKVNNVIRTRANQAFEFSKKSNHYSRCFVPDEIAYVIFKFPQLVAKAVNAYYYRDQIQLRYCKKMERFPFKSGSNGNSQQSNSHYHILRFTRCLYAMLATQQLDLLPNTYPKITPQHNAYTNASDEIALTLGYMLACGFEILYQEEKKKLTRNPNEKDNVSLIIDDILQTATYPLIIQSDRELPDSDEWMNISPEEVDDLLQKQSFDFDQMETETQQKDKKKREVNMDEGLGPRSPQENLIDFMVKDVRKFMENSSNYEGVVEEGETSSEEDDSFYKVGEDVEDEEEIEKFSSEMRKLMSKMDEELSNTTMGQSFEKSYKNKKEVDLELNLIKNFLSSHEEQMGLPGPVSTLLRNQKRK